MNKRQKIVTAIVAGVVVLVVAAVIVVVAVLRTAEVEAKRAECERWPAGSADRYLCLERADD